MPERPGDSPESSENPNLYPNTARDSDAARSEPLREDIADNEAGFNSAAPGRPPGVTGDPAAGSSGPVNLLHQILDRLQRMEGGLTQHEQWLRRIEEEQRQAETDAPPSHTSGPSDNDLQRLVGSLTLERDRAQKALAEAEQQLGAYQQELAGLRKQSADLQACVAERDRELNALKASAGSGVEQAKALQAQAQRNLLAREQQIQSLQSQLNTARQQLDRRDQQIAELQAAVQEAAEHIERLSPSGGPAEAGFSRFARLAVVAAFASAFASVGLTSWLYQQSQHGSMHTATTTLLLSGADERAFELCVQKARQENDVNVTPDAKAGIVELRYSARDREAAKARVEALADNLLAGISPLPHTPASQPTLASQAGGIAARIAAADRELNAAAPHAEGQPVAGPAPTELAAQWQSLAEERAKVLAQLEEVGRRLESTQTQPAAADITPEQIARSEAADQHLQAESEALKQREDQLAGRLRVSIDAAALQFESLQSALTDADSQLQKDAQQDHPEAVGTQLDAIRDALKTWARAVTELDAAWKRQRPLISAPGSGDALAVQSALEKAARAFVDEITPAASALTNAVEAIGQGQDQTTKRLVLRNALTKQLAPVTTAQQTVAATVRAVILTENVELAGIVQRLDALRRQVQQRRVQIATALRQERLAQVQKQRTVELTQVRQAQQALARRAAEIESTLLGLGEQATQHALMQATASQALTKRAELLQAQRTDLKSLVGLHEQFAAEVARIPAPPSLGRLPTTLLANESGSLSMLKASMIGAVPVLACAIVLMIAAGIAASRRSRQTIEDYARTLKETARRASLGDEEPALASESSESPLESRGG